MSACGNRTGTIDEKILWIRHLCQEAIRFLTHRGFPNQRSIRFGGHRQRTWYIDSDDRPTMYLLGDGRLVIDAQGHGLTTFDALLSDPRWRSDATLDALIDRLEPFVENCHKAKPIPVKSQNWSKHIIASFTDGFLGGTTTIVIIVIVVWYLFH